MKVRPVYNLEFPPWCPELNIYGYRFTPVDDYQERILRLQHLNSHTAEFSVEANTGMHSLTAFVELPIHQEKEAIFDWSGNNNTALRDVLLLLSLFTGREVFVLELQNTKEIKDSKDVITADSRVYSWGGILSCSTPYKKQPIEPEPFGYDIGFEESINQIYELIRSDEWQKEYHGGYFLLLAKMAFRRQALESSFVQCWTIWEHLFAILNDRWLSNKQIRMMSSAEKITFLLVKFALIGEIDNESRKSIEALVEIRNKLIHFGRFPKSEIVQNVATRLGLAPEIEQVHHDTILFIRLTEFIITKILGLSPSNVFNTVENLEVYLKKIQKPSKPA